MAVITKDLGAVSAYAVAVANGFTGTEAEWEQYMANAANNAMNAAGSATAAANSAASAAQSATEAATSKVAAAGSAVDAENSALVAGNHAAAAAASATAAETAETGAETAQTAAEAAQAAAEAVAASIPEDYTELSEEVGSLKSAFDSVTDEHIPTNHAVISNDNLVTGGSVNITYNDDGSVNFTYDYDLGNPITAFALTGVKKGKTYTLSAKLDSGNLSKITIESVNLTTHVRVSNIATATKTGDIYSVEFTVPSNLQDGQTAGVVFYFARSLSRDVTLSDFNCVESGDVEMVYIPEEALSKELQDKINAKYNTKISFIGGSNTTSECTLIKLGSGQSIVIDSGYGNRTLIYSEMERRGITHIDYMFVSHYHPDHAANVTYFGQEGLFDENTTFILPMLITEDMYTEISGENPPYWTIYQPEVLETAETYGCTIYRPSADWDSLQIGDAKLEFINVDHSDWFDMPSTDYNNCSLCAYLTIGNVSIFFSGDIGLPVMNKYKKNLRHCTIFKANHHAEGYDVVPVFMGSISPDIVVTMQGARMITKTGTPSIDNQFYYKSTGLQSWCEKYHVYNYLTSFNENAPIGISVNPFGYFFDTKSRASNRFEEGIYSFDDPDIPDKNVNYFDLT